MDEPRILRPTAVRPSCERHRHQVEEQSRAAVRVEDLVPGRVYAGLAHILDQPAMVVVEMPSVRIPEVLPRVESVAYIIQLVLRADDVQVVPGSSLLVSIMWKQSVLWLHAAECG